MKEVFAALYVVTFILFLFFFSGFCWFFSDSCETAAIFLIWIRLFKLDTNIKHIFSFVEINIFIWILNLPPCHLTGFTRRRQVGRLVTHDDVVDIIPLIFFVIFHLSVICFWMRRIMQCFNVLFFPVVIIPYLWLVYAPFSIHFERIVSSHANSHLSFFHFQ